MYSKVYIVLLPLAAIISPYLLISLLFLSFLYTLSSINFSSAWRRIIKLPRTWPLWCEEVFDVIALIVLNVLSSFSTFNELPLKMRYEIGEWMVMLWKYFPNNFLGVIAIRSFLKKSRHWRKCWWQRFASRKTFCGVRYFSGIYKIPWISAKEVNSCIALFGIWPSSSAIICNNTNLLSEALLISFKLYETSRKSLKSFLSSSAKWLGNSANKLVVSPVDIKTLILSNRFYS